MGRLIDQDDVLMCLTGDITGMDIKDYIKMVATNIKALPPAQPTIEPSANCSEFPNNSDTISRQAAIDALRTCYETKTISTNNGDEYINYGDAVAEIEQLPSAQSERKKGRWLPDNRPGGGFWVCSCCKFPSEAFAADVLYKFCPNCGADMRGKQE